MHGSAKRLFRAVFPVGEAGTNETKIIFQEDREDMGDQRLRACPYCAELIKEEAIKCFHCKSILDARALLAHQGTWYRAREGRTLFGVCAGLSRVTGFPVLTIRLAFILLTLLGGHGIALYAILFLLMPSEPAPAQESEVCRTV